MSNRGSLAVSAMSLAAVLGVLACRPATAAAQAFQTATPEELKMTKEPLAPGAPAIVLYRQVDRYDNANTSREDNYFRIKILTEEGRHYANVEIPFIKDFWDIAKIKARTTRPDGSTIDFDGKVFEKPLLKEKRAKYMAKAFTLRDVQVGSIIEYRYTIDLNYYLYDSHWILSEELFTKKATFSLTPFSDYLHLRWTWQGLPPGAEVKLGPDRIIRMEANNIPAFQTEEFMPPENELKARVDFIYSEDAPEKEADKFWKKVGKKRNDELESFIGKRKAMDQAVAEIISPSDSPETKLRKIYDRVQQIRNTSYELEKTEQEEKRKKEKVPENVENIWKRGYGSGGQLTWLYLALVRAAGFDAYGVLVASRDEYFFTPSSMQSGKLIANVVLVKLNGKDLYFDPGAAFTPFGLLPWAETGVSGLQLDKNGGSWIVTTLPQSSESRVERNAKLKLSDTGDLQGTLTITYIGLEAMYRRLDQRNSDDVARKTFLEDEVKEQVPAAIEVDLTNKPDWTSSQPPLLAEFSLKIPGWASGGGKRAFLPVGLFAAVEKRMFEHADRVHPIYFEYPFETLDEVTIELPARWKVATLPKPQNVDGHVITYALKAEDTNGALHVTRKLNVDVLLMETKYYPALRNFFQTVRTADEETIVLEPAAATAAK